MYYCINYIGIILHGDTDIDAIDEIENHLSMNGYCFGIDKKERLFLCMMTNLTMQKQF